MKRARCVKCGKIMLLNNHHILPKPFKNREEHKAQICGSCHDDLHYDFFPGFNEHTDKPESFYFEKWEKFLKWTPFLIFIIIFIGLYAIF